MHDASASARASCRSAALCLGQPPASLALHARNPANERQRNKTQGDASGVGEVGCDIGESRKSGKELRPDLAVAAVSERQIKDIVERRMC